jgi:hypothetical protein
MRYNFLSLFFFILNNNHFSYKARKVYLTALSMYHSFPERDQFTVPLLYYMFAKLELENNRPNEALKILVSMADTKSYGK